MSPELANPVASRVASALHASAGEVVRAGLRLLAMDAGTAPRHVGLRAMRREIRHD